MKKADRTRTFHFLPFNLGKKWNSTCKKSRKTRWVFMEYSALRWIQPSGTMLI